jgi:hypothetical protein
MIRDALKQILLSQEAKLVVIRTYQNAIEADLAKGALDGAGIPSILSDSVSRQYISLALPLQLLMRAEDAEDAEKILDMDATEGEAQRPE